MSSTLNRWRIVTLSVLSLTLLFNAGVSGVIFCTLWYKSFLWIVLDHGACWISLPRDNKIIPTFTSSSSPSPSHITVQYSHWVDTWCRLGWSAWTLDGSISYHDGGGECGGLDFARRTEIIVAHVYVHTVQSC